MEKETKSGKVTKIEVSQFYFGKQYKDCLFGKFYIDVDGVEYEATMPIYLDDGVMFDFRANGANETRSVTEKDQIAAMKELAGCIGYASEIKADEDSFSDFIEFAIKFRGDVSISVYENCETVDRNGVKHLKCYLKNATSGVFNVNSWLAKKFPKAHKKPSAPAASPSAPKPPTPPAPKTASKHYAHEDAWKWYCDMCAKKKDANGNPAPTNPNGPEYWDLVSKITGKSAIEANDFTDEDWRKCVEKFTENF